MFQIGDVVYPSASRLKWQKKRRGSPLSASTKGIVIAYKAPVLVDGVHIGRVIVKWEMSFEHGLLYQVFPERWDHIRR